MQRAKSSKSKRGSQIPLPSEHNWNTSDQDERNKRIVRARTERFAIRNLNSKFPIFSEFQVQSESGLSYQVEIRSLQKPEFSCSCVDFQINGLGTCKHVEAVLIQLHKGRKLTARAWKEQTSPRFDILPDSGADNLELHGCGQIPPVLKLFFDRDRKLKAGELRGLFSQIDRLQKEEPRIRVGQEARSWFREREQADESIQLRRDYEQKVQLGEWPQQETRSPLFPYQREGMLHLAFKERALLADEMGLGKTIQAIAACALLHRLGKAERVLVVTPASLKTEWEEQIQRFTGLSYQLVFGGRARRLEAYERTAFFTIVNYEQMISDSLEVNRRVNPQVVVLDEAQRIKNWSTKTTQAIKRLQSRYAFVLTGTPLENRIDELRSILDFLNPQLLGPLFRFNREYYELNDMGRPVGYRNLDRLRRTIAPYLLRRRKADVEKELPDRTDRNHFVPMVGEQVGAYQAHEGIVARLAAIAKRRPLTQLEQEKLQRELAMMRMICDTPFILDPKDRTCPKLGELEKILEECRENPEVKVIVFSEWERMLQLVRDLCGKLKLGYAWHTGSVPQQRRRAEINAFKQEPNCRVFLSTDSGATGLNLQNASVVINCDLPWNPAKLEQRIARAWRKNQTRPVTVINLVSENSIEHRMLETLSSKQALSDAVLDSIGDVSEIPLKSGKQNFLKKLEQLISTSPRQEATHLPKPLPADRPLGFAERAAGQFGSDLVRCEHQFPGEGGHSVLLVVVSDNAAASRPKLEAMHQEFFGPAQSDPLAPVRLEVIDRQTDEALHRLVAAGLISLQTRGRRQLYPAASVSPLTEEENRKIAAWMEQGRRKLKMARALQAAQLLEEAAQALRESVIPFLKARALKHGLPEPVKTEEAIAPPWNTLWNGELELVESVLDPNLPLGQEAWESSITRLEKIEP